MGEKAPQPGRISQTDKTIDTMVRPSSSQRGGEISRTHQSSRNGDALRIAYVAGCLVADAAILPIVLAYALGWMWIFVLAVILVPVIYLEYRGYNRAFGPQEQVRHVPSDHIPEFHAADKNAEGAPDIDERE